MKKVLTVMVLGVFISALFASCSSKKTTTITMDPDTIVSIAISGYPIIFANGDSIDSTTDISKITELTSAFNKLTLEYYKSKEDWDKISTSTTGSQKAILTFYNAEKKCVERISRISNSEGSFILKYIDNDIYVASEKDYNALNSIFDTLLKEAEDGRLNN